MKKRNQYFPKTIIPPGETLREKLEGMNLTTRDFALLINETETLIAAILIGKAAITPDLAAKFEQATRIPAEFWLNYQKGYDEYLQQAAIPAEQQLTK